MARPSAWPNLVMNSGIWLESLILSTKLAATQRTFQLSFLNSSNSFSTTMARGNSPTRCRLRSRRLSGVDASPAMVSATCACPALLRSRFPWSAAIAAARRFSSALLSWTNASKYSTTGFPPLFLILSELRLELIRVRRELGRLVGGFDRGLLLRDPSVGIHVLGGVHQALARAQLGLGGAELREQN